MHRMAMTTKIKGNPPGKNAIAVQLAAQDGVALGTVTKEAADLPQVVVKIREIIKEITKKISSKANGRKRRSISK